MRDPELFASAIWNLAITVLAVVDTGNFAKMRLAFKKSSMRGYRCRR